MSRNPLLIKFKTVAVPLFLGGRGTLVGRLASNSPFDHFPRRLFPPFPSEGSC